MRFLGSTSNCLMPQKSVGGRGSALELEYGVISSEDHTHYLYLLISLLILCGDEREQPRVDILLHSPLEQNNCLIMTL